LFILNRFALIITSDYIFYCFRQNKYIFRQIQYFFRQNKYIFTFRQIKYFFRQIQYFFRQINIISKGIGDYLCANLEIWITQRSVYIPKHRAEGCPKPVPKNDAF
jgi:hypothetical protein